MVKPQGVEEKENLIVSLEHFDDIFMVDKSINHGKLLSICCTPYHPFALSFSCCRVPFLFSFPFDRPKPRKLKGREV